MYDVAFAGVLNARYDFKQGGLACTIASYEAYSILDPYGEGDVFEQGALSEVDADLIEVEHRFCATKTPTKVGVFEG